MYIRRIVCVYSYGFTFTKEKENNMSSNSPSYYVSILVASIMSALGTTAAGVWQDSQHSRIPIEILAFKIDAPMHAKDTEVYLIMMQNFKVMKIEASEGAVKIIMAPTQRGWYPRFAKDSPEDSELTAEEAQGIYGKILVLPKP